MSNRDGADSSYLFVRPSFMNNSWRLAGRRPGSFHDRRHEDAGLVDEDYRGFPGSGFFLIRVHV